MNVKQEMENIYVRGEDAWRVTNSDKTKRNDIILSLLKPFPRLKTGLDLCCGEGAITHKLPCETLTGIDISEIAIGRAREKYPHIRWIAKNISEVNIKEFSPNLVCWIDSSIFFDFQEKESIIKQAADNSSVLLYSARLVGKKFKSYRKQCEFDSVFEIDSLMSRYFSHTHYKVAELDFFSNRGHGLAVHLKKCLFSATLLAMTKLSKDKYSRRCDIVNRLIRVPIIRSFALPLVQHYAVLAYNARI